MCWPSEWARDGDARLARSSRSRSRRSRSSRRRRRGQACVGSDLRRDHVGARARSATPSAASPFRTPPRSHAWAGRERSVRARAAGPRHTAPPLSGVLDGGARRWSEGVRLRLDRQLDQMWLLFEPWTFIEDTTPRAPGEAPSVRTYSRFSAPDASSAASGEEGNLATRRKRRPGGGGWNLGGVVVRELIGPSIHRLSISTMSQSSCGCLLARSRPADRLQPPRRNPRSGQVSELAPDLRAALDRLTTKIPPHRVLAEPDPRFRATRSDARSSSAPAARGC